MKEIVILSRTDTLFQLLFMCHRRPDRSFHRCNGKQFPICARCTGIFAGYFLGIACAIATGPIFVIYAFLLLLPTVVDGFIQLLTNYESTNIRRLITGLAAGVSIVYIIVFIGSTAFSHGAWIANNLL